MTKVIAISFFLSLCHYLNGQKAKSYASTYTYTEADGIDEENFMVSGQDSNGKVVFHAHTKSLFIKGSSKTEKIPVLDPANKTTHIGLVYKLANDKYLAIGTQKAFIIEKGLVVKTWANPNNDISAVRMHNEILLFDRKALHRFSSDSLINLFSSPDTFSISGFYVDDRLNIYYVTVSNQEVITRGVYPIKKHPTTYQSKQHIRNTTEYIYLETEKITPLYCIPHTYSIPRNDIHQPGYFYQIYMEDGEPVIRDDKDSLIATLLTKDAIMNQGWTDGLYNSFYIGTFKKPLRCFPHIKTYPGIYKNGSSNSTWALAQDKDGNIWAGGYDGYLSIIGSKEVTKFADEELKFIPAFFNLGNHVYLSSEKRSLRFGRYKLGEKPTPLPLPDLFVYSAFVSPRTKTCYLGTGPETGLYITSTESLEKPAIKWKIVDSTKGISFRSISDITEDKLGRIWFSNAIRGIGIYYPRYDSAVSWEIQEKSISFSAWSLTMDSWGTIWIGSDKDGLKYLDDYSNYKISIRNIKSINHPLLNRARINQMLQWKNWLVLGTEKNLLLLNLDQWHRQKKIVVRYLNPQEANLTSALQHKTMLVDSRDSSIWYATADMIYQWDIAKWLSLPTYRIVPAVSVSIADSDSFYTKQVFKFKAKENSFKVRIDYQAKDNMPRFISAALIQKGDSLILPPPSFQNEFEFINLRSGRYNFVVQVFQANGEQETFLFPIEIKKFWWQHWWLWSIASILFLLPFFLWWQGRQRSRLTTERARRQVAELESNKAELEQKLTSLRITSISNQFRPHFILNALQTIGAKLEAYPNTEKVLSRLGASISLIYKQSSEKKVSHAFKDEWELVTNLIEIHRLMYLKELNLQLPLKQELAAFENVQVPLGLLQVVVENSLLHGLNNKETGPWNLEIKVKDSPEEITFEITDNGVGRQKAEKLSNFRKHGTGIRNIKLILDVLNSKNTVPITLHYEDGVFNDQPIPYGTRVEISIPKKFNYELTET